MKQQNHIKTMIPKSEDCFIINNDVSENYAIEIDDEPIKISSDDINNSELGTNWLIMLTI